MHEKVLITCVCAEWPPPRCHTSSRNGGDNFTLFHTIIISGLVMAGGGGGGGDDLAYHQSSYTLTRLETHTDMP